MSVSGRRVLVTRPEPGLSETMDAVHACGFVPVACPMLCITHEALARPVRAPDAILITSGQSVPALETAIGSGMLDAGTPVLAVGDRSAGRARAAGFIRVESASGNAADLLATGRRVLTPGAHLLLLSGRGVGTELAQACRDAGFRVTRRVAYSARPVRSLSGDAWETWAKQPFAALFFSAVTAHAFTQAVSGRRAPVLTRACAIAMSDMVARNLPPEMWQSVRVARQPDVPGMLQQLLQQ